MADTHVIKHARADSAGNNHVSQTTSPPATRQDPPVTNAIRENIRLLQQQQINDILTKAAESHQDVADMVSDAVNELRRKEETRVINFDFYSKDVWKSLNITHKRLKSSMQFEVSFDVVNEITDAVDTIVERCTSFASPQTRLNGITVLRKIGKSTCLAPMDTLGAEVTKQITNGNQSFLADGMLDITRAMPLQERKALVEDKSTPDAFWPKLIELDEYGLFTNLQEVMDLLQESAETR